MRVLGTLRRRSAMRRVCAAGLALILGLLSATRDARGDESAAPEGAWHPNRTLEGVGIALLLSGYVPDVAVAVPSTAGFVGRAAIFVVTLGLVPILCENDYGKGSYVCNGTHGSMELLLPVAGPFLFASTHPSDSVVNPHGAELTTGERWALYASGTAQGAGVLVLAAAIAAGRREPAHAPAASRRLTLQPMLGGGSVGLSLRVAGW